MLKESNGEEMSQSESKHALRMGNIEWMRIHPIRGAWWHDGSFSPWCCRNLFETNCCHAVSLNKPIFSYQTTGEVPRKYQLCPSMTKDC